ncbi:hypothetical protein T484DRAFT_3632523 [Baffinella frigidus]|nr:hypothetical protein T484DRAFT_3632523 [Cryptophyta sp. CCMP2293]
MEEDRGTPSALALAASHSRSSSPQRLTPALPALAAPVSPPALAAPVSTLALAAPVSPPALAAPVSTLALAAPVSTLALAAPVSTLALAAPVSPPGWPHPRNPSPVCSDEEFENIKMIKRILADPMDTSFGEEVKSLYLVAVGEDETEFEEFQKKVRAAGKMLNDALEEDEIQAEKFMNTLDDVEKEYYDEYYDCPSLRPTIKEVKEAQDAIEELRDTKPLSAVGYLAWNVSQCVRFTHGTTWYVYEQGLLALVAKVHEMRSPACKWYIPTSESSPASEWFDKYCAKLMVVYTAVAKDHGLVLPGPV